MSTAFAFRYGLFRPLLSVFGMGPSFSEVTLEPADVAVRMGWAFRSRIPYGHIRRLHPDRDMHGGIGVHGWRGLWLVNGAVSGIVTLEIDPPVRARVLGLPIRLRTLHLSLEDPAGLIAALRSVLSDQT